MNKNEYLNNSVINNKTSSNNRINTMPNTFNNNNLNNTSFVMNEDVGSEIDNMKIQIELLSKKQFEIISSINNDKSTLSLSKIENDIMDLKTELVKNKKYFEEIKELSNIDNLNRKLSDFKNQLEIQFKNMNEDGILRDVDNKILILKKEVDEFKLQFSDPKYMKESKRVKVKQIESLEQVTVEVQRLSDGLNNLFSFTQAYIDSQAYERERIIHGDSSIKEKMDCLEFLAKNLEFISDEAITSVVTSFEEISVNSIYNNQNKQNVSDFKYNGQITNNIMDMIIV